MKKITILLLAFTTHFLATGQKCGEFLFVGIKDTIPMPVNEVLKLISAPLIAIDNCGKKMNNRSGDLIIYNKQNELVASIRFSGALSSEQRTLIIEKIRSGVTLQFEQLAYGDPRKFVPNVKITVK